MPWAENHCSVTHFGFNPQIRHETCGNKRPHPVASYLHTMTLFLIHATEQIWCLNWIYLFWLRSQRFSRPISKFQRSIEVFFFFFNSGSYIILCVTRFTDCTSRVCDFINLFHGFSSDTQRLSLFWMCRPTLCAVSCKTFAFSCMSWGWCTTRRNSRSPHLPCSVRWMPFPGLVLSSAAVCSHWFPINTIGCFFRINKTCIEGWLCGIWSVRYDTFLTPATSSVASFILCYDYGWGYCWVGWVGWFPSVLYLNKSPILGNFMRSPFFECDGISFVVYIKFSRVYSC